MIFWLFMCLKIVVLDFGDCCAAGMAEAGRERNSGKCQRPKVASPWRASFSRKNERADRRSEAQLCLVFSLSRGLPIQPRHPSRGSGLAKKTTNFGEKCQTPLAHSHLFWVHLDESMRNFKSRKTREGKWIRIFMTFWDIMACICTAQNLT